MKKAFYPPLVAVFLVLALFNANSNQLTSTSVVWLPILASVGGVCAIWALGRLTLKSWNRAALPTCILTIMLLEYGHFRGAFQLLDNTTRLLWVAELVLITIAAKAIKKPPTEVLNALAIGLVLTTLVPFGIFALHTPAVHISTSSYNIAKDIQTPDIYYIIPDEYSRGDVLLDMCDFNNSEFLDYLRDKGFYVANESYASYPATPLSIAATLNMDYLPVSSGSDLLYIQDLYNLICNNEVYRQLKQRGYTIIHLNSWWNLTDFYKCADVNYSYDSHSEFYYLFCDMLLVRPTRESRTEHFYNCITYQFDKLKDIPSIPEPTFTLVHSMVTHAPYLFNSDGSFRGDNTLKVGGEGDAFIEAYTQQIEAANGLLREAIDAILAKDDSAVIIIQSDTGTCPRGFIRYLKEHNGTLSNIIQEEPYIVWARLANLNAIYSDCSPEYVTSANTFRLIFNHYFNTDYLLLPNRYFYTATPPYDLYEVTDALEEYANERSP